MKSVKTLLVAIIALVSTITFAQEEDSKLEISGSVDTYFKYDFSGTSNSPTSFAGDQNSMSIGMIDLGLSKTVGAASFVAEIAFGPRGQNESLPIATMNVQNLYASLALSESLSATAGYMGTFVGYEVISPAANFNYSTSYLFSYGPFQNAGFKLDYAISDKVGLMLGAFNDWNVYTDVSGISDFGAQLSLSPVDGLDAYINYVMGPESGSIIDLTAGYQISDAFYLGINAADYTAPDESGYSGVALYPQYALNDSYSVGVRYENFMVKDAETYNSTTLTLNYYTGPLTLLGEIRLDSSDEDVFMDADGAATGSFSQILFAAIYSF